MARTRVALTDEQVLAQFREDYNRTLTKADFKRGEKLNAIQKFREIAPPGTKFYGTVTHVSRSGMYRHINFKIAVCEDGKPAVRDVTGLVCEATGYAWKDGSLGIGGCGMDMVFAVVYHLSENVWRDTPEAEEYRRTHETSHRSGAPGYIYNYDY